MPHSSHHAVLLSLLKKSEFAACRAAVEDLISEQMDSQQPDDLELAHLHVILCRALFGLHDCLAAGDAADLATFLGRKVKAHDVMGEALYRAGICYAAGGEFRTAVARFTAYLDHEQYYSTATTFKGDVLYGRGYAYDGMRAYSYSVQDYESALKWMLDKGDTTKVQRCRQNLAWALILRQELVRAEQVLTELEEDAVTTGDELTTHHVAHDRTHMRYLEKDYVGAITEAVNLLDQAGNQFPQVRCHVALTLIAVAQAVKRPQEAAVLAVIAERLAGQAHRPDLEAEANELLQTIEGHAGTECLAQALFDTRQWLPGSVGRRRRTNSAGATGGVH